MPAKRAPQVSPRLPPYTAEQQAVDVEIEATVGDPNRLAELRSERNSFSPIGRLPADVLREIFQQLHVHPLDTVLPVCRQWAKICSTTFSLWRVHVALGMPADELAQFGAVLAGMGMRSIQGPLARVAAYQHNRIHTLDISLLGDEDLLPEEEQLLADVAPHLMVFRIRQASEWAMQSFIDRMMVQLPFARLASLLLAALPHVGLTSEPCLFPLTKLPASVQALSLTRLRVAELTPLPALTELCLTSCLQITQRLLLELLRHTPRLRSLTLMHTMETFVPPPPLANATTPAERSPGRLLPVITLERLESLRMTDTRAAVNVLLPQLVMPSLSTVALGITDGYSDITSPEDIQPILELVRRLPVRPIVPANLLTLSNPTPRVGGPYYWMHAQQRVELLSGTTPSNICVFSLVFRATVHQDTIIAELFDALAHAMTRVSHVVLSLTSWDRHAEWVAAALRVLATQRQAASTLLKTIELDLDRVVEWTDMKNCFLPALLELLVASQHASGELLELMKVRVNQGERRKWSAALRKMKEGREGGLDDLVDCVEVEAVPTKR